MSATRNDLPEGRSKPTGPDTPASPVPGRGERFLEFGLRRMQASWVLRACAVVAFMAYGGLIALMLAGELPFGQAGIVALLSLASWFFLFWWYPVLERTRKRLGDDPRRRAIGAILEVIAVSCVVLVHVLMAVIVVYAARS